MKRLIYVLPFLLIGCMTSHNYVYSSYKANDVLQASVGSVMLYGVDAMVNDTYGVMMSGMRSELLYMGMENNILNIQYREYTIDSGRMYIRDKYTQNVKFDLSKGKEITCGNIRMEVLGVDNNGITFKVLDGKTNQQTEISKGASATSKK